MPTLLLLQPQFQYPYETRALAGPVEGFVRTPCDLPLHHTGGGTPPGVRAGGEGTIPHVPTDVREFLGLPGAGVLSHEQTKYCVPTLKSCSFGA